MDLGHVKAAAGSCFVTEQQGHRRDMGPKAKQTAGLHWGLHHLLVVARGCIMCACAPVWF